MTWMLSQLISFVALIGVLLSWPIVRAGGESTGWKPEAGGQYLDQRENVWFGSANCVQLLIAGLPYALARPALRKIVGATTPTEQEKKLLAQIKRRVVNWTKLDTEAFGLFYDSSDAIEEAILGHGSRFQHGHPRLRRPLSGPVLAKRGNQTCVLESLEDPGESRRPQGNLGLARF